MPETFDAQDLVFTRDGNHLVVWESPIKTGVQVYQIIFSKDQIQEVILAHHYIPYDSSKGLGIRCMELTSDKQYFLAGCCD